MNVRLQLEIFDYLVNQLRQGHNYESVVAVSEIYSDLIRYVSLIFDFGIGLF